MKRTFKYIAFCAVVLLLAATGCDKEKPLEATGARGDVLKVEELKTLTLAEVKQHTGDTLDKENQFLHYGIKCYRLTYTTIYENEPIATTALLLLPNNDTVKRRLCVYLHGTNIPVEPVSAAQKMPSNYFKNNQKGGEVAVCAIPLASNGFSVVMPDYIGYGDTKDKEHPFVYYPELHFANIDGLRAMCRQLQLKGKQDVYIGGYSQGGGAALSLHYYIQTDYSGEFNVLSSSCLSGPYNYVGQIEGQYPCGADFVVGLCAEPLCRAPQPRPDFLLHRYGPDLGYYELPRRYLGFVPSVFCGRHLERR